MSNLKLSPKQLAFLRDFNVRVDILEGSIRSGKTHIAVMKFMLKVLENDGRGLNVAFAKNANVFGRNVIPIIMELFPDAKYSKFAKTGPSLTWRDRTINIIGFDTTTRFKDILGANVAVVMIDEFNIMPRYMLEEILGRQAAVPKPYLVMTANPDDPDLDIYEIVNRSTMIGNNPNAEHFTNELDNWRSWFFTFEDNPIMTKNMIKETKRSQIPGTIYYQTKIEGLRKKAEGLIFGDISEDVFVSEEELLKKEFKFLTIGVDTAYSKKSEDTIAIILQGFFDDKVAVLEEFVHNNKKPNNVLTASELPKIIAELAAQWEMKWQPNRKLREVYIDNADANLINEGEKWRKSNASLLQFTEAYKAFKIIDRIQAANSWINTNHYLVNENCEHHKSELKSYAWSDKQGMVPVDRKDHTINAGQYGWIPYRDLIGINKRGD